MDHPDEISRPKTCADKVLSAIPNETTPEAITPAIERLCKRLSDEGQAEFVPVFPAPSVELGKCHRNVAAQMEREGGLCIGGWLIWEMPRILLNAKRYCCWQSRDGVTIDITPKPEGETKILFLPDPRPWDGGRVCPAIEPLSNEPPVTAYIAAFLAEREQWEQGIEDFALKKKLYEGLSELNAYLSEKQQGKGRKRK
jgi:hypothetical protein